VRVRGEPNPQGDSESTGSRHRAASLAGPEVRHDVRRALHLNVMFPQTSESSRTPDARAPRIVAVKPPTTIRPGPVRGSLDPRSTSARLSSRLCAGSRSRERT
jgi:hypothetical protein